MTTPRDVLATWLEVNEGRGGADLDALVDAVACAARLPLEAEVAALRRQLAASDGAVVRLGRALERAQGAGP